MREPRPHVAESDTRRLPVTASKVLPRPLEPPPREIGKCLSVPEKVSGAAARRYRRPSPASSQLYIGSPLRQEGPPVVFMLAKTEPAGPADFKVVVGERGGQEGEKEKDEDQR